MYHSPHFDYSHKSWYEAAQKLAMTAIHEQKCGDSEE
jgi:hypothetical protein